MFTEPKLWTLLFWDGAADGTTTTNPGAAYGTSCEGGTLDDKIQYEF